MKLESTKGPVQFIVIDASTRFDKIKFRTPCQVEHAQPDEELLACRLIGDGETIAEPAGGFVRAIEGQFAPIGGRTQAE